MKMLEDMGIIDKTKPVSADDKLEIIDSICNLLSSNLPIVFHRYEDNNKIFKFRINKDLYVSINIKDELKLKSSRDWDHGYLSPHNLIGRIHIYYNSEDMKDDSGNNITFLIMELSIYDNEIDKILSVLENKFPKIDDIKSKLKSSTRDNRLGTLLDKETED